MDNKTDKVSLGEMLLGKVPGITESSSIQLTDEEKEAVLDEALQKKIGITEFENKRIRNNAIMGEAMRQWNSTEMLEWIQWRAEFKLNIEFKMDAQVHPVAQALCRYFTNDKRFEGMGDGWSLNKGILLAGNIGTGKTTMMKLFAVNKKASFKVISCRDMADKFSDMGAEVLHTHSKLLNVPTSIDTFYQDKIGICFDDLGTERQGKHYGNDANVMEQIILNRYDHTDAPWFYSHLTTNLTAAQIENAYGSRVRSRMREMFNLISLTGEDRRK